MIESTELHVSGNRAERVVVLAVHPPRIAATRLRIAQYIPFLRDAGFDVTLWTFLREEDLPDWYGPSTWRRALVVLRNLPRVRSALRLVRTASVVVVQREALPLGPPLLELAAARSAPLVWDVDDSIWVPFRSPTAGRVPMWIRATGGKYERVCRRAADVWVGSEVLAEWCRQFRTDVQVVPTAAPVPAERPTTPAARAVGWIGSHSTGPFLEQVLPAVLDIEPPPEVLVVGTAPAGEHPAVTTLEWSEETENAVLARIRVGLYPIDRRHPLAEGKCGFKAVLYMSRGIPPVVTPTRTNATIVGDGVEGLHAETPDDWRQAVTQLLEDDPLWDRLSRAAHERAREHFSMERWAPVLVERLRRIVSPSSTG